MRLSGMALTLAVVLATALLATLVVGASAANGKASHPTRVQAHRTTAHPLISQGGGTVPVTG